MFISTLVLGEMIQFEEHMFQVGVGEPTNN